MNAHESTAVDLNDPDSLRILLSLFPSNRLLCQLASTRISELLHKRYKNLGVLEDLDDSIAYCRRAIEIMAHDDEDYITMIACRASLLDDRFDRCRRDLDLDEAIASYRQAIKIAPADYSKLPSWLNKLAISLRQRFTRYGEAEDLIEAIASHRKAIEIIPAGHRDFPGWLSNLGNALDSRFSRYGEDGDLTEAIASHRQSIELTPADDSELSGRLNNLASSLYSRFTRYGENGDLTEAIASQRRAVELAGRSDLPLRLHNLGNLLDSQFSRYGQDGDLTEAVAIFRKSIEFTPAGHYNIPIVRNKLAISLRQRFNRYGEDGDLTEAIASDRIAIELTPAGHTTLPGWFNSLGISLRDRFTRYGEDTDLTEAISNHRNATELTPTDHSDLPSRLTNLATALCIRFDRYGDEGDLTETIASYRKAIELTPAGYPSLPGRLNNLAVSLQRRVVRYGEDRDMAEAVETYREAIKLVPADHVELLPLLLNNLADSLHIRFNRNKEDGDLTEAIATYRKSVELTPANHIHFPSSSNNLGISLQSRFKYYGEETDLNEAISVYRKGSDATAGFPTARFDCALGLASFAHEHGHLPIALEGYSKVLGLLSQVAWFGQSVSSRQRAVSSWQSGLASDAAACAISLGRLELAVEFLDHGRSVFWSQATQTSADLTELEALDPSLASKFEGLAAALSATTFEDPVMEDTVEHEPTHADHKTEQRRRFTREFESLLDSIRALPGLHNFMKPPSYKELCVAATAGPVVLLNASKYRSDALIITMDSPPILVTLPDLPLNEATRLATDLRDNQGRRSFRPHLQKMLPLLWRSIVLPVLEALDFTAVSINPQLRPHVWWCPTGPLSFLPIHAAGPYTKSGGPDLTHRVISSYTVTLQALLRARKQSRNSSNFQMLLVGQADTPHQKPLPGVSEEIQMIYDLACARGVTNISRIEGANVLKDVVMDQLKGASRAHFACHGHQDQTGGALQSALFVHDGPLRLSTIASCRLSNADFAFLSACESASGLDRLPDEAMHIAAGMQAAGFRSVIATMWAIADGTGPIVAEKVYSHLLRSGPDEFDSAEAAFALNEGVQCLRKGQKYPTDEWVPFIHIGI
jgi:tetratricopeptide (TPR) repeat protein/CHAT domain-containing protein